MSKKRSQGLHELLPWEAGNQHGYVHNFIRLGHDLFQNPQWKRLNYTARYLYECMILEAKGNRSFKFPLEAIKRYDFNPSTARSAIKELVEGGFIDVTFHGKVQMTQNEYQFSFRYLDAC